METVTKKTSVMHRKMALILVSVFLVKAISAFVILPPLTETPGAEIWHWLC